MIKPYDPNLNPTIVTIESLETYTGLNNTEILLLCGLSSIPTIVYEVMTPKLEIDYPDIYVTLKYTGKYKKKNLSISIMFRVDLQYQCISDNFCRSTLKKEGIGYSLIKSQVDNATRLGFKELRGTAIGDKSILNTYNGYITWGKLGYIMHGSLSIETFSCILAKARKEFENRNEKIPEFLNSTTLIELLSTTSGESFWIDNGSSWQGLFNLAQHSESRKILKGYEEKRKNKNIR